jgi:hypothetical protein
MKDTKQATVKSKSEYHAYVLRVWQEEGGQGWRVSLQPTQSPERFGFTDLQEALAFVERDLSDFREKE